MFIVAGYFPRAPPPRAVLLLHPSVSTFLSGCDSPGLRCGQTAALFTSRAVNVSCRSATFAGNSADSGASLFGETRLLLFISSPGLVAAVAHSFISRPFRFFFFPLFPNLISSIGAIFSYRLQAVTVLQKDVR